MFALTEGIKNFFRARIGSAAVVFLTAMTLIVGGWFYLLTVQLSRTSDLIERTVVIEAFLEESADNAAVEDLRDRFTTDPSIAGVTYISKDSAAAIFRQEVGEDIEEVFGENPLPSSFRISPVPVNLTRSRIDSMSSGIAELPGVDDTILRREYLLDVIAQRNIIFAVHLSAGIVLFLAALFLIVNVIKLSIYARHTSIGIMKLIGATNRFISAPFIIEGVTGGTIAGLLAGVLSFAILKGAAAVTGIAVNPDYRFYAGILLAGMLTGFLGSVIAIRRFL